GHVDEGAWPGIERVVPQGQAGLAREELEDGGHRGGVLREFLPGPEAEEHGLDLLVVVERTAQDAALRRLGLACQVADVCVGRAHAASSFSSRPGISFRWGPPGAYRGTWDFGALGALPPEAPAVRLSHP